MRILMVLDGEFPPDIRVENEIEQLQKLGHHITLACFTMGRQPLFEEKKDLLILRTQMAGLIRKTSVGALKFPFYFNYWRKFLSEIFLERTFDAIHIHDLPLAKIGFELGKKFHIPIILDLHENWPALIKDAKHTNTFLGKLLSTNAQWNRYEAEMVTKADKVIAVAEEMKERIVKIGASPEKVFVVPNYFNFSGLTKNTSEVNSGKTLFYAGGLTPARGLQIAIRGMAALPAAFHNLKLVIVGFGSYEQELRQLTEKLSLNDKVIFLGQLSQQATFDKMTESDIMLIPHMRSVQNDNSSPNKLYQYMFFEKPVLASNCKSIQRVVNTEKVGVIYEHDNPDDFAAKLILLIKNNKNNMMGRTGRKAVLEKFNWSTNAKTLQTIYNF